MDIVLILKKIIYRSLANVYPDQGFDLSLIELEHPRDMDHGEYSTNICLKLASLLRCNPQEIALVLAEEIGQIDDFFEWGLNYNFLATTPQAVGGFLNFYLSKDFFAEQINLILEQKNKFGDLNFGGQTRVVVEHTAVNPNKAIHIGHLRNSILGDSLARILIKCGYSVKIENYIDDTGVQVADIVTALEFLGIPYDGKQKFDHFCWDLYRRVQIEYAQNPDLKQKRVNIQLQMERGKGEYYEKSVEVVKHILSDQLRTLADFDIYFDFLFSESIILQSNLWPQTFEILKNGNHVVLEKQGVNKDCWVLKNLDLPNKENMINPDKVLVTSKGNITYTAKDIAHHLWKFGLVANVPFVKFSAPAQVGSLWFSQAGGEKKENLYKFDSAYAVVDCRQAYNFDVIKSCFKKIGYADKVINLHHIAYGLVSLSRDTVKELGFEVKEEKKEYEMSGRKGIGVKADDFLLKMVSKVAEKSKDVRMGKQDDETSSLNPTKIATGAIKAYMLKFNLNNNVVFDINEALQITGDSGPYLQYTYARIKGILSKAGKLMIENEFSKADISFLRQKEELVLLRRLYRFGEQVGQAGRTFEPGIIYNYLIVLAQNFNSFYNQCPILNLDAGKNTRQIQKARLALIEAVSVIIKNGLYLLGIEALEKM